VRGGGERAHVRVSRSPQQRVSSRCRLPALRLAGAAHPRAAHDTAGAAGLGGRRRCGRHRRSGALKKTPRCFPVRGRRRRRTRAEVARPQGGWVVHLHEPPQGSLARPLPVAHTRSAGMTKSFSPQPILHHSRPGRSVSLGPVPGALTLPLFFGILVELAEEVGGVCGSGEVGEEERMREGKGMGKASTQSRDGARHRAAQPVALAGAGLRLACRPSRGRPAKGAWAEAHLSLRGGKM
jgi:hypothetical protein